MPLTPADIHNMAFKKPPMGKRGYDEEEVDGFLDEVEQQLIRLLEENEALRGQANRPPVNGAAGAAMNAEFSAVGAHLARVQQERARAEQEARDLQIELERARSTMAERPARAVPGGDDRTSAVLLMAQRTADDHLHDARLESDTLLSAARDEAEQIARDAQIKASTTEGDARRNHTESMTTLQDKRAALLEEIERLGQLAQSYQAALNSHMKQQLQDMDGISEDA